MFSLKDSQKLFIQSLDDDIVDIEKPDVIYSPNFVLDAFSGLFLQTSIFFVKHSISA